MAHNLTPRASQLLKKLSQADFYAQDLKLYLDTHPDDKDAIAMFHKMSDRAAELRDEFQARALELYREAVREADACRCAFESEFYPLRASSAGKECSWDWLCGQWIL